jgi:putative Ca2+/H+ antiporter (TMEM165/GDT1 family)
LTKETVAPPRPDCAGGAGARTAPGPAIDGGVMKTYVAVFGSVLLAEMGDKTQLAVLLFATNPAASKLGILAAAAGALVLSSLLAVLVGVTSAPGSRPSGCACWPGSASSASGSGCC